MRARRSALPLALLTGCLGGGPEEKPRDSVSSEDSLCRTFYWDADDDGYGDPSRSWWACVDLGSPWVEDGSDCDDESPFQNPGVTERCNDEDDDCDGEIDEGYTEGTVYLDADGDGYGDPLTATDSCRPVSGWVSDATDCDDDDDGVHPGAEEVCNREDDDCDGEVDEGFTTSTWYRDWDSDGHGDPYSSTEGCEAPYGYVADGTDCDDGDPYTNPGEDEDCGDGWDRDCDGLVDCEDADCDADARCGESDCADGVDGDEDGYVDCDDDECWGGATCPTVVVARIVGGDEAQRRHEDHGRSTRHWCGAGCPCSSGDDYWTGRGDSWDHFEATEVEGTVRTYEPGASAPRTCAWGLDHAERWTREEWHRTRSSMTTSASSSASRDDFWVSGDCGRASSAFLPPLSSLAASRTRWFEWYAPWFEAVGSFSDGDGTSGASCSFHYYHASVDDTVGYPILVGARWVCTSDGDCELR